MFSRDIDRMFEQMRKDMLFRVGAQDAPISASRLRAIDGEAEGYRTEIVNGERTDYYLEDGDWKRIDDRMEENSLDFEIAQKDETYEMTIDLTSQLPNVAATSGVEASLNNGILSLSFEMDTDDESDEE